MKKQYIISIFSIALLVLLMHSCQNNNPTTETATLSEAHQEGLSLMLQNCYTCHNPETAEDNRLAPPMIAVKRHYLDASDSKEEFIAAFTAFWIILLVKILKCEEQLNDSELCPICHCQKKKCF